MLFIPIEGEMYLQHWQTLTYPQDSQLDALMHKNDELNSPKQKLSLTFIFFLKMKILDYLLLAIIYQ